MRKILVISSLSSILLLSACGTGDESEETTATDIDVSALEEENEQLNQQIENLEQQISELEQQNSEKQNDSDLTELGEKNKTTY